MSWLEQQVRQSKLLEVMLCVLAIAAVVAGGLFEQRYLMNVRAGPYAISASELAPAKSVDDFPRYWVQVRPQRIVDTGVDHVTIRRRYGVETGRSVTGHFWAGLVGDRLMFIEARGSPLAQGQTLTGYLTDTPQNISSHLMRSINPALKDRVLPVMLDLGNFESSAYVGLAIAGVITLIAAVWAALALRHAIWPRGHAKLRALEAQSISLDEAGASIQHDIRAGDSLAIGSYRLTREYLMKTGVGFDVRQLKDLLWAYPIVVSHRLYYVIPAGKSHKLALHFPDKKMRIKINKVAAERVMPLLASVAPWTMLGHSPDLERAWNRQRAQFVEAVAARRAQVLAQWASQPQPAQAGPASA
jgi:Family of unknown function (DUF6709)